MQQQTTSSVSSKSISPSKISIHVPSSPTQNNLSSQPSSSPAKKLQPISPPRNSPPRQTRQGLPRQQQQQQQQITITPPENDMGNISLVALCSRTLESVGKLLLNDGTNFGVVNNDDDNLNEENEDKNKNHRNNS